MIGGRNSTEILPCGEVVIDGRDSTELSPMRKCYIVLDGRISTEIHSRDVI